MIRLFVVDASTDTVLRELLPGDVINPAEFPTDNFSILAEVDGTLGEQSLVFFVDGVQEKTENLEPYALFGDSGGNYKGGALFADGPHTITATAYSGTNGTGTVLSTITLAFDVQEVVQPTIWISSPIAGDDFVNAAEVSQPLEISGTTTNVEDGQTVTVFLDGQQFTGEVSDGAWTVTVAPEVLAGLDEGPHEVTADVSDVEGVPAAQATATFTIDTLAPDAGVITGFDTDTGAPGDGITADTTPTLQGTSEPGSTVEVFDGGASLGAAVADASGNWSFTAEPLPEGDHSFAVVTTDAAGNMGATSEALDVTIEPAPSGIRLFIVDADTDQVVRELLPGDLINPADFPNNNFAILAEVDAGVGEGSLVFYVDGVAVKTESRVPYAIFGDDSGDFDGGPVFADGAHTISATAFSASGGGGSPLATVSIDVTVGTVLEPSLAIATPIAGDDVLNAVEAGADLTISGTTQNVEDGQTVTVMLGAATVTAVVTAGAWSATVPAADLQALAEGPQTITADVATASGTPAPQATASLTVDTVGPGVPVILGFAEDTGNVGDGVTADTTPTLSGTAEPGSTIAVFDGTTFLGTTSADGNGDWSFTATPLPGGAHVFTATATDAAGNASAASDPLNLLIGGPTIAITTPIAGDDIVNAAEAAADVTVSGTTTGIEAGQTVTIGFGALTVATTVTAGAWAVTIPAVDLAAVADGDVTVTADASDAAGIPAAQAVTQLTLDTAPPAAPVITGFTNDTGAIGDGATSDTTPTLSGTAEAGATVEVFDGAASLGTTIADASGVWALATGPLALGPHALTASATDAAGNTGAPSPVFDLTIEEPATDIRLYLVDSDTDQVVRELLPGDTIEPADFPNQNFAILAEVDPSIGEDSLVFYLDGVAIKTEHIVPYAIFGDKGGNFDGRDVFSDGPHTIGATAFSQAKGQGTALSSVTLEITVGEVVAPTPTISIITPLAGDDILNAIEAQSDLTISGTTTDVEDGQQVTVTIGGVPYLAAVSANAWSVAIPVAELAALTEGAQPVTADVANLAGTPAIQASTAIEVDTIVPIAPVITSFSDDTGTPGDGVTSDTTPTLSGTAEAGATIEVFDGATSLGITSADINGDWSFTTAPLAGGAHSFTATATDAAGNEGPASAALDLTIGETPTVTITTPIAGGGAGLDFDFLNAAEAAQDLDIAGTTVNVEDGQSVTVMIGGQSYDAPVTGGSWSVTIPSADLQVLGQGVQPITADVTNAAGIPAGQASETIFVDTVAPDVPVIESFADDTGNPGDGITTDTTPIFTGTAEVDSLVTLFAGTDILGIGVTNGAWSIAAGPLAPGTYTITATATDDAGNVSSLSAPFDLTIAEPPTITITTPVAEDDILNAGEVESELIISGVTTNVEDGQTVTITFAGLPYVATVTANAWAATVPIVDLLALPEGGQTITADVTNLAGEAAVQASAAIEVDTIAPDAPVITGFTDDTGVEGDGETSDTTPTLSGTAEAGSTIEVLDGSEIIGTTTADINGDWSFTTDPLAPGLHTFSALAVDAAGNAGPSSADLAVTIVSQPVQPTIVITTPIAGDDILNAAETGGDLAISGTTTNVEDGREVTVTLAGLTYLAVVAAGAWTATIPAADLAALGEGDQTVTADVSDLAGVPADQASTVLAVDTLAPDAPVITGFADDTGALGDGNTEDATPTLSGTAEAGATVEVFDGGASLGTVVADGSGDWSFTTAELAEGVHQFTATAQDAAGNTSAASAPLAIDITDTTFAANQAGTMINRAHAVVVADVDGDGDNDIVTAATLENRLIWLENDGAQAFTEHVLPADLIGAYELDVIDLDEDGDLDFLGVGFDGDSLIWYESDGAATPDFTSHVIALGTVDAAHSVSVADLDGDTDLDIVVAAQNDSAVYWFENDGAETFTQHTVDTLLSDVRISDVGDFDGDGDIDIVSAVQGDSEVVWHENDGSGVFTSQSVGDVGTANSVVAIDIDGDGDLDVAAVGSGDNTVHWFENNSDGVVGADPAFTEHLVFNHVGNINLFSVSAADLDNDGDIDLMASARSTGEVFWYEQQDDGSWSQHTVFDSTGNIIDVGSGDVDGDGDTDILAADQTADIVFWFDNDTIA